ncbi:cytochrome b5-like [Actinidia eriantha]|uniref:cytochrome b5-like n=1 Tax=Actinidia eriantha TaxID=165200 RepID=UPI00258DDE66|nr:cytochrome b5-like [Actinidia eriantha]
MEKQRIFTLSQVAQHKSKEDCWFIINGRVLDVTKFLEEHPGGEEVLLESAGKDATKDFDDIGHSQAAKNLLVKYQVGFLQGYGVQESDDYSKVGVDLSKEWKTKEMKAFVIKEDPVPKYKDFIEFFVPLLVAGFFFGYRYLTGAVQFNS